MPHYGKKLALDEYVVKFGPSVLIETGTYTGHMVLSMLDQVKVVYSVELDKTLHLKAVEKFSGYKHVHLLQGESDKVLQKLLPTISDPCLFWLDADYSGGHTAKADLDTPIMNELEHILNHPLADQHILLIDDARCFGGTNDYPHIDSLKSHILQQRPDWVFEVKDDIMRTYSGKLQKKA